MVLKQNKQALLLVPEINLTPQIIERFKRRFAMPIGIWHSKLTDKERLRTWLLARNGVLSIIIGTRSAQLRLRTVTQTRTGLQALMHRQRAMTFRFVGHASWIWALGISMYQWTSFVY